MTEDERKLLSDLADKIANTPTPAKDPDAEQFIRTRIGSRPDALYLMTQTVVIQNIALQQAQAQIQQLRASAGQPGQLGSPGSFTGQAQQTAPPPRQAYAPQYAPPPPSYAAPSAASPSPGAAGGGGFLRGAAQTAAGVAAGALAFEGISSLFHGGLGGFGGGGGIGSGGMFGGGGIGGYSAPVEENVVNNYYEGGQGGGFDDRGGGGDYGRDDFQAADDAANAPDSGYDDSANQPDDTGGFDDGSGGGFDDGSGGGDNFA